MGLCDRDDRIGWRIFDALRSDCHCCTFYRGVAIGFAVAALAGAALRFIL